MTPILDESEDAVEGVTDSVNKLKNALMGFDELNILQEQMPSEVAGIAQPAFDLDLSQYDYDFLSDTTN